MSTSAIEVSGKKVKAMWDKRLTEIFCDICIKEILKGNRSGKGLSQRQLKNRWNALKKEWKAWKKLKGEDTGLGWNPIKRTVDASDDWWESRLKVVPEAQKFRTSDIDPEFEGKLDQMFMGIVATGDKAWAPSSGTLYSDIFEYVNNEIPEENEEENVRNDVHILNDVYISNDVQIDGNGQKRKNPEISSSHFKTGRKKSSKQIGGATRLSSQIEKLCNATDNMSQATSSLAPVMDPYGIPQAVKVLDSMSEEVPEASLLYFFALRLLLNKDKRTMFLSINPKIRALWLKTEMEDS
ncbi:L10-interacting MYB domain-containing protein [Gossypium hirsutum]|uniref:L10-interacting MYB domain-containing protein n=1 Tax=Gossypium hirsutum TaxID=3635 RepID=A0ABM2ZDB5_GOSHI|nr:L10-interacting MYB domain-containing protein [Gossypium hirsutum]